MLEEFFTAYVFRGMHLAQQKLNICKSTVRNRLENIKTSELFRKLNGLAGTTPYDMVQS